MFVSLLYILQLGCGKKWGGLPAEPLLRATTRTSDYEEDTKLTEHASDCTRFDKDRELTTKGQLQQSAKFQETDGMHTTVSYLPNQSIFEMKMKKRMSITGMIIFTIFLQVTCCLARSWDYSKYSSKVRFLVASMSQRTFSTFRSLRDFIPYCFPNFLLA